MRSCVRDLAESEVTAETRVRTTGTVVPGQEHRAVLLKVRSETKTGQRSVPSLVGEVVDGLQGPYKQRSSSEDPLNCGYKSASVLLLHLRFHFNDVVECLGFKRFCLAYHSFHRYDATQALLRGVSTSLVARALGTIEKNA